MVGGVTLIDANVGKPVRAVGQQGLDAAVAFLLVLAQGQTGESLRLGQSVTVTELTGVRRQQRHGELAGLGEQFAWRFAGFHPAGSILPQGNRATEDAPRSEGVEAEQ